MARERFGREVWILPMSLWSWHFARDRYVFLRNTLKKINLTKVKKSCAIWALVGCSWSGCSIRLHTAEPGGGFGSQLSRFWSRVWPAECHPCSPCGAADSLDFHQNSDDRSVNFRFLRWGPTPSYWDWRLCHLEGRELHAGLLLLLETATLLPACAAAFTGNNPFTTDRMIIVKRFGKVRMTYHRQSKMLPSG